MTITRLNGAGIEGIVGEEASKHLRHKNQGGENNFKGGRYEEFFGGHQIAKLARTFVETGEDAFVEWQSLGFVDDYMVRQDAALRVAGYQLKNANRVSWTAGDPPIVRDFELQHAVCRKEGYEDIRLSLVCSSEDGKAKLVSAVPDSVREYATAVYFPYAEPLGPLFFGHAWLAEDFGYLSKTPEPTVIDAQQVAQVMAGAWFIKAPAAFVSEVLEQARQVSPQILRALAPDSDANLRVSQELRAVLDAIPDFRYDVAKGFLRWNAVGGLMSGVLPFDCFSDRFAAWQQEVTRQQPKTFEELEGAKLL